MNTRQWLNLALIGAAVGAVALVFVGFKSAGLMTSEAGLVLGTQPFSG